MADALSRNNFDDFYDAAAERGIERSRLTRLSSSPLLDLHLPDLLS